jgi:hypothetical protein
LNQRLGPLFLAKINTEYASKNEKPLKQGTNHTKKYKKFVKTYRKPIPLTLYIHMRLREHRTHLICLSSFPQISETENKTRNLSKSLATKNLQNIFLETLQRADK